MAAKAGLDIGIIICNINLHSDAPSSFAASINSFSTCIKYCLNKKIANAFVMNGNICGIRESIIPHLDISR